MLIKILLCFLTSKLIACLIDDFTLGIKSMSIAYLISEVHIYILNFRHWRWSALNMRFMDKRPSRIHGQCFVRSYMGRTTTFDRIQTNLDFFLFFLFYSEGLPPPLFTPPIKAPIMGGWLWRCKRHLGRPACRQIMATCTIANDIRELSWIYLFMF